ncbi:MAG: RDD family protein [Acidimicrobiales bacterium]
MSDAPQTQPPGWYYAQGDPPGTQRYWDGQKWEGGPQPVPGAPQDVMGGPTLAEPLNRIGARIIDGIIWLIISFVIGVIFGVSAFATGSLEVSYAATAAAGILSTLAVAAYEIYFVGSRGQTPGKMALGLKVTRADGSPVDFRDAAMRMAHYLGLGILGAITGPIGFLFNLILLVILIASLVFLFTDSMRQTVWDKIAKTIVVAA